ncbi:MAG: hypothetical protein IE927_00170 [Rhodobacterales bacterium]|nr:hypothetical protein [Rhodobacterales bacterium]
MKMIALTAAALAALATTASAMTAADELTPLQQMEIQSLVKGADLGNLTTDQILALQMALHAGEDNDRGQQIRAILN